MKVLHPGWVFFRCISAPHIVLPGGPLGGLAILLSCAPISEANFLHKH